MVTCYIMAPRQMIQMATVVAHMAFLLSVASACRDENGSAHTVIPTPSDSDDSGTSSPAPDVPCVAWDVGYGGIGGGEADLAVSDDLIGVVWKSIRSRKVNGDRIPWRRTFDPVKRAWHSRDTEIDAPPPANIGITASEVHAAANKHGFFAAYLDTYDVTRSDNAYMQRFDLRSDEALTSLVNASDYLPSPPATATALEGLSMAAEDDYVILGWERGGFALDDSYPADERHPWNEYWVAGALYDGTGETRRSRFVVPYGGSGAIQLTTLCGGIGLAPGSMFAGEPWYQWLSVPDLKSLDRTDASGFDASCTENEELVLGSSQSEMNSDDGTPAALAYVWNPKADTLQQTIKFVPSPPSSLNWPSVAATRDVILMTANVPDRRFALWHYDRRSGGIGQITISSADTKGASQAMTQQVAYWHGNAYVAMSGNVARVRLFELRDVMHLSGEVECAVVLDEDGEAEWEAEKARIAAEKRR